MGDLTRLLDFDTPTVANGLERLGLRDPSGGYTGPDVSALMPELGARVGVAVTARMDTTSPGTDDPPERFRDWLRIIEAATGGDGQGAVPVFAVVEGVGLRPRRTVALGDGMATIMRMGGVAGFLTNGCIRDLDGVRGVPMACWGVGVSPMHGRMRWLELNGTVVVDGMTVRPGDVIHADVNGALVIPRDAVDDVRSAALAVQAGERELFARLRVPGMTLGAYLAAHEQ